MTSERGSSLVVALIAAALLSVFGLALTLLTMTEMTISSAYSMGQELAYVAEAGLEIGEQELRRIPDWNTVLAGAARSTWVDGDAAIARTLEDGSTLRLVDATNFANCGKASACSADDLDSVSDDRPWGRNNPRWQLFASGPLNHAYVAVWVSDDAAENDDNPLVDGQAAANPGAGVVAVRSEAFGMGGGHKVFETTVRRSAGPRGIYRLSWAQIR
jgi:hypothetical protein